MKRYVSMATASSAALCCSALTTPPLTLVDPQGVEWRQLSPPTPTASSSSSSSSSLTTRLDFSVVLRATQEQVQVVSRLVEAVSDPDNEQQYGQFLTREEVVGLTRAPQATVQKVQDALQPCECRESPNGDGLACSATPEELGKLFSTDFSAFKMQTSGDVAVVATGPLVIPEDIHSDVAFVLGLTELPWRPELHRPKARLLPQNGNGEVSTGASASGHSVVPDTIRLTYNVPSTPVPPGSAVAVAVAEFAGADFEKQSDLTLFGSATGLGNLTIAGTFGPPNDPQADPTEATLDIQYLASTSLGNTNYVWNSKDWMFTMATSLVAAETSDRPSVVSVSYAWNEAQQCHGLPGAANCSGTDNAGYINRTNLEFQKLALLGTTVLVASGDSGAHGRTDRSCVFNPKMHPDFPASSPFVTTVGGTQFTGEVNTSRTTSPICSTLTCAASGHEMVASANRKDGVEHARISSGGGFSEYTPIPEFQKDVVATYLSNGEGVPPTHLFNAEGRAYPDISALSHNYFIKINGENGAVDGTSAATPVIAGLVGRINAHRAAKGQPAVGFFNPLLYKIAAEHPEAFNDITEGSNRCSESGCLCQTGFGAAKGWDAASGLGTPNFANMLKAIDAIDARREAKKIAR